MTVQITIAVFSFGLFFLSCTSAAPNPAGPTYADTLVINELVIDPQQDWNDTSGGNAVPFDGTVGDGLVSAADEWIELYNASTQAINLSGWSVEMIDGTPAIEDFSGSSGAVYVFSGGSSMSNLLPGGFLVIGNPQGDMTMTNTIRLLNPSAQVVDIVTAGSNGLPDGNANDVSDEALAREDNASTVWVHQTATIGANN